MNVVTRDYKIKNELQINEHHKTKLNRKNLHYEFHSRRHVQWRLLKLHCKNN